jgi:hypothetical protein
MTTKHDKDMGQSMIVGAVALGITTALAAPIAIPVALAATACWYVFGAPKMFKGAAEKAEHLADLEERLRKLEDKP